MHDEAERLEHAASDELIDRMAAAIGEPTHDPHGAPIPTRDGTLDDERRRSSLGDVAVGERVRIQRVGDRDARAAALSRRARHHARAPTSRSSRARRSTARSIFASAARSGRSGRRWRSRLRAVGQTAAALERPARSVTSFVGMTTAAFLGRRPVRQRLASHRRRLGSDPSSLRA